MLTMKIMKADLKPILDRIDPTFGRHIDCDEGWWELLIKLHNEVLLVDPEYRIFQVKEKFGTLRFYYSCSSPHFGKQIDKIVARYERISALTCERTGKPGQLMQKGPRYKTLHHSFEFEGWKPVDRVS